MKNSVALGSLSGIHEYNIGKSSSNDQWGNMSTSSFSNYGGVSEKPKNIQSTESYLDKIQKKYNMNNNGHNDPHDFPIAQRVMTENKDGNYVERVTIKNQNDATPPIFQQYEQQRVNFRQSQRGQQTNKNNNNNFEQQQYVSGRIQQTTENTNYGQFNNGNYKSSQKNNNFQMNNNNQSNHFQNNQQNNQKPQINMQDSIQNSSLNNSVRQQQINQSDNNFVSMVPGSNYKSNHMNNSNQYNNNQNGFYANDNNNIY